MRKLSSLCRTLLAFAALTCAPAWGINQEPLQHALESVLTEEQLAGVTWALLPSANEVSTGHAGFRDLSARQPFDEHTQVHVGSITKSLLATGVLQLATEERLDLNAPALTYLPSLFPGDVPKGFEEITVRHLLDHTAGLDDARLWQMFSERARADAPLGEAFPDPHRQLRLRSTPGSQYSYSNIGYTLLGMIIENVIGERYEPCFNAEHVRESPQRKVFK